MDKQLSRHLAQAIDEWRLTHHNLEVMEVLRALELIRYKLTEDLIKARQR